MQGQLTQNRKKIIDDFHFIHKGLVSFFSSFVDFQTFMMPGIGCFTPFLPIEIDLTIR